MISVRPPYEREPGGLSAHGLKLAEAGWLVYAPVHMTTLLGEHFPEFHVNFLIHHWAGQCQRRRKATHHMNNLRKPVFEDQTLI